MEEPTRDIVLQFGHFVITSVQYACYFTFIFIVVAVGIRLIYEILFEDFHDVEDREALNRRDNMNDLLLQEEAPLAVAGAYS